MESIDPDKITSCNNLRLQLHFSLKITTKIKNRQRNKAKMEQTLVWTRGGEAEEQVGPAEPAEPFKLCFARFRK